MLVACRLAGLSALVFNYGVGRAGRPSRLDRVARPGSGPGTGPADVGPSRITGGLRTGHRRPVAAFPASGAGWEPGSGPWALAGL
jgi:hypothetical protein